MSIAARVLLGCLILASVAVFLLKPASESDRPASTLSDDDTDRPIAVVDKPKWNFGPVPIGQELRATFAVRNVGTRRLILADQSDCCGSDVSQIIIAPSQTKELVLRVPTDHRPAGAGCEMVCYETNDPLHPTLQFTMSFELTSNGLEQVRD